MTTVIISKNDEPGRATGQVIIPPPASDEAVIKNTFFFPDIDPKRVRELLRLEHTVSPARLRHAIKTAISETNADLYDYRELQMGAGVNALADVKAETIDGEHEKVALYLEAVVAMTSATLYEKYRSADATGKGDKKAEGIDPTIDNLWRDMRRAVARLQGKPRCIVGQI